MHSFYFLSANDEIEKLRLLLTLNNSSKTFLKKNLIINQSNIRKVNIKY